jgi:hypothetical protein
MARYATIDQQTLEMALIGYEFEKQRVEAAITQIACARRRPVR